jgi:asparagine synthetase B (glutamine-hydrolysing)
VQNAVPRLTLQSRHLSTLENLLLESLTLRVQNIPGTSDCPIAVLFSGGLDSTLLAYYCDQVLKAETPIDLINVAFQNPRVHKNVDKDPFAQCPDRITGHSAWESLRKICSKRQYRLICVNVPYVEYQQELPIIKKLMHPHNTEMDLSVASALYFAAKATGTIYYSNQSNTITRSTSYTSPSRILLSGLGADELFAGYNRHAIAFQRRSFAGLLEELELDFNRIGRRNLGRDDRVTSHWGREMRYPFLDEDLVSWAVKAQVWEKCGFGMKADVEADGLGVADIEPGKLVLRLLAWKADLKDVAVEKKRAVSRHK